MTVRACVMIHIGDCDLMELAYVRTQNACWW